MGRSHSHFGCAPLRLNMSSLRCAARCAPIWCTFGMARPSVASEASPLTPPRGRGSRVRILPHYSALIVCEQELSDGKPRAYGETPTMIAKHAVALPHGVYPSGMPFGHGGTSARSIYVRSRQRTPSSRLPPRGRRARAPRCRP